MDETEEECLVTKVTGECCTITGKGSTSYAFVFSGLTDKELAMMRAVGEGKLYVSRRRGRLQFVCVRESPGLLVNTNAHVRVVYVSTPIINGDDVIIGRVWSQERDQQGSARLLNLTHDEAHKLRLVLKGKFYVTVFKERLKFIRVHRYPFDFLSKREARVCVMEQGDEINIRGKRASSCI